MLFGSPFAICLRDFEFEKYRNTPVSSPAGPLWSRGDSMLKHIVEVLQPLKMYSVAHCEMLFPDRNVSWIYLSDSEWEAKIRLYMIFASLIVIVVDKLMPGVNQEIQLATDPSCSQKTLLFISETALRNLDGAALTRIRWKVPLQDNRGFYVHRSREGLTEVPEDVKTFVGNLPYQGVRGVRVRNLEDFDNPQVLEFCENELLAKHIPAGPGAIFVDVDGHEIRWASATEQDLKRGQTISLD